MTEQRFATVLLFGAPGVGKGTQGKTLGTIPGIFHLSTGDIFRSLDPKTEVGREASEYITKGELVPDELTVKVWRNWLREQISDGSFNPREQLLLLDGIPRNTVQCQLLGDYISVKRVLYLACSEEELLVERIQQRAIIEGRPDDANEEVIRHRFEVYRAESAPVLKYYPAEVTSAINPLGMPAEVLQRILQCLLPVLKSFEGQQSTVASQTEYY